MQDQNVPQGFAAALAQNEDAVNAYAMMTQEEKDAVLAKANKIRSKWRMNSLIRSLARDQRL